MLRLLRADRQKGWRAFQRLFDIDLMRLIRRRLPGAAQDDARREAYQAISLALVEADCRRLFAFAGQGSFAGFVMRTVDRLLIDHLRNANARQRAIHAVAAVMALNGEAADASPEMRSLQGEEQALIAEVCDILARAIATLAEPERLYLDIVLAHGETPPARDIALLMQRPVEDIYKLKQRVLKHLRDLISEETAVKIWRASV
jgi:DNA-directed RNA polymerase specialized sigma24 family protein